MMKMIMESVVNESTVVKAREKQMRESHISSQTEKKIGSVFGQAGWNRRTRRRQTLIDPAPY